MSLWRNTLVVTPRIVACLTGVGCSEPQEQSWPGQLVTFTSSEDVRPCGGTVEFMDRYAPHVYEYWTGSSLPDEFDVRIDLRRSSPEINRGLATLGGSFAWVSDQLALRHELNHVIVSWEDGSSAPVFREGAAEILGPTRDEEVWGPVFYHPDSFAFLPTGEFAESGEKFYAPAAKLMRSLIHRYGVQTVRAGYRRARPSNTAQENEAVFVDVFGDEVYDAFDEYMVEEHCSLQAWECSESVLPLRELPVVLERSDDCAEEPDLMGALAEGDDKWYPLYRFVIDLPQDAMVRIDTSDNVSVRKMTCKSTCDNPAADDVVSYPFTSISDTIVFEVPWTAGRHSITVRPIDVEQPFSATIEVVE